MVAVIDGKAQRLEPTEARAADRVSSDPIDPSRRSVSRPRAD
jgi:hypothetical protein